MLMSTNIQFCEADPIFIINEIVIGLSIVKTLLKTSQEHINFYVTNSAIILC